MLTMHDVVSPAALTIAKIIGYGVFGVAWSVIMLYGYSLYCKTK